MRISFFLICLITLLISGCNHIGEQIGVHTIQNNEITQVHTGTITEKNGYFLINPTTYWFKYGGYFMLFGQIDNPTIEFSGQKFADISNGYITFGNIKIKYPGDAKAWSYGDQTLHGYTLRPEQSQGSARNIGISKDYFINERYHVGDKKLLSIRYDSYKSNMSCDDKNNETGPGAWIANQYFSQNIYQKEKINIYKAYRGYGEEYIGTTTTRDSLCFVLNNKLYTIQLYNYTKDQTDIIFDSLEFIK